MKFASTTLLATSLALVSASPIAADSEPTSTGPFGTKPELVDVFRLMSLRTGTPVQYGNVQAVKGGLRINYAKQDSHCTEPNVNYASFKLSDKGDLYLNTDNPPLQAFVDRSGMGQGVLGFTTGMQPIGKNWERGPFKVDDDSNLVFAASNATVGFQACPVGGEGEGYSVWLSGVDKPAGLEGCTPFTAKAIKEETPIKCLYFGMAI